MSQFTKLALGAAAVIVAIVLFVVLRPDGEDGEEANPTPATETTAEETTTEAATGEETTTEDTTTEETTTTEPPAPPPPQRIRARFQDGEVVGGIKEVDVDRNQQVVVLVQSDVADEVHVHGYNLSAEVAPGRPARIAFDADVVGRFEIELESRSLQLVDLRVRP
jgi:hypothetical protein